MKYYVRIHLVRTELLNTYMFYSVQTFSSNQTGYLTLLYQMHDIRIMKEG